MRRAALALALVAAGCEQSAGSMPEGGDSGAATRSASTAEPSADPCASDPVDAEPFEARIALAARALACPRDLTREEARALLESSAAPADLRIAADRLTGFAEWQGLAHLVAGELPAPAEAFDEPVAALVLPLDASVLAKVARARIVIDDEAAPPEDRTRAAAYLAKVYAQAWASFGIAPGSEPTPFSRALAAQCAHALRRLRTFHTRHHVVGLGPAVRGVDEKLDTLAPILEAPVLGPAGARVLEEGRRSAARRAGEKTPRPVASLPLTPREALVAAIEADAARGGLAPWRIGLRLRERPDAGKDLSPELRARSDELLSRRSAPPNVAPVARR